MRKSIPVLTFGTILFLISAIAKGAIVTVEISAPGMQSSTVPENLRQTESFDLFPGGLLSSTPSLIGSISTSGSPKVQNADVDGGASLSGKYVLTNSGEVSISFSGNNTKYLGFWWSTVGDNDQVQLFGIQNSSTESLLKTVTASDIYLLTGGTEGQISNSPYFGNPNTNTNQGWAYVYVNLTTAVSDIYFSRAVFSGTYFEFDNVSVSSVPEPSTLSLLAIGLGGLTILRRRRS